MNEKEFLKWLDKNAPVVYQEVERFSDEAGASIWIRFDLDKLEDIEDRDDDDFKEVTNE
jgi:hypothetical protein